MKIKIGGGYVYFDTAGYAKIAPKKSDGHLLNKYPWKGSIYYVVGEGKWKGYYLTYWKSCLAAAKWENCVAWKYKGGYLILNDGTEHSFKYSKGYVRLDDDDETLKRLEMVEN